MAIKEFENFEYKEAKIRKAQNNQRLKYASIAFGVVILLAVIWAFFSSLNLFGKTSTSIRQPIVDTQKNTNQELDNQKKITENYKNANIPYKDPNGRFEIKFLTPYVSNQIVVYINSSNNPNAIKQEADAIIAKAKQTVDISNVYYINNY